jgi:lysine-specific demethylase/histidyl-hydroxylase NO66
LEEHKFGRSSGSINSKMEEQAPLFALLLHVAIRLLTDSYPTLRKACMVAAKLPSSSSSCPATHSESLRSSHRSTFAEILGKINTDCDLEEALRSMKLAVTEKNNEPFQWMSWLRHLPQHRETARRIDFCDVLGPFEELLGVFSSDGVQASADFVEFRSRFCRSVAYEDACQGFETLLQMYKTVRNRYTRGMLALHGRHSG